MIRKCVIILIETYWNVNSSSQNTNDRLRHILIETYWNVNKFSKNCIVTQDYINRDILECKSELISYASSIHIQILIETYWNVNNFNRPFMNRISAHINRDILECKSFCSSTDRRAAMILIETYWNVNVYKQPVSFVAPVHINRDILECKYRYRR